MKQSNKNWSTLQSAEEMDVGRFFEYDEDALYLFQKWFEPMLTPGIKVLEIGSGSGFFTNKLLTLFPEIKLTCLEPDDNFVELLAKRFGEVEIKQEAIETTTIKENSFDVVLSHIVIHNLDDPIKALNKMKFITKSKGWIITIEPLPASRNYYPEKRIEDAFDVLFKARIIRCMQYNKDKKTTQSLNPWKYCYPQFFEQIGLKKVQSHGWTSIFTLSDNRFDFDERKNWIKNRINLVKNSQEETTKLLLENGEQLEEINDAYETIYNYFEQIEQMSKDELEHVHEQEIVHRIITIGQKP